MKLLTAILFYSVFTGILGLVSYYIYIRGLQSIPPASSLRSAYTVAFWFIALSFIAGRAAEKILPVPLANLLIWVGSFWLAAMLYFFIAVVLLDFLRVVNHFLPFFPRAVVQNYSQTKYITAAVIASVVGLLLVFGHINSVVPRITTLHLSVAKKSATIKKLNIVVASDIHLGTIVGRPRLEAIVNRINELSPDLVLLPGDIVDEDLSPVIKQNPGEAFAGIKSRFGVYASTGNHEFIAGVEKACAYLTRHNITMLRDESVKIGDSFFLVGREDRMINRFTDRRRKELPELMAPVDKTFPVIMMDHQPFGLEEVARQGVDLQLSGHTHDGQLWPFNYIVDSIYELSWGYRGIGDAHFYVSDGVGTWGPPVRIGNRPEIVNIILSFE
jgi:predicted MPP superfamily phosphohydrolase